MCQLHLLNDVILGLFVVELLIRMGAHAEHPAGFFRSGWNVFDFIVIGASFVPGVRENATLLRLVRLLRIVRAVRLLPDLRVLTVAVGRSVPGVASLAAITLLLVYVYGMIGWVIFHDHDPANFANIGQSMVTMFVLLDAREPAGLHRARPGALRLDVAVLRLVRAAGVVSDLQPVHRDRHQLDGGGAGDRAAPLRARDPRGRRRPTTSRRTRWCSRSGSGDAFRTRRAEREVRAQHDQQRRDGARAAARAKA